MPEARHRDSKGNFVKRSLKPALAKGGERGLLALVQTSFCIISCERLEEQEDGSQLWVELAGVSSVNFITSVLSPQPSKDMCSSKQISMISSGFSLFAITLPAESCDERGCGCPGESQMPF
jgi:hypothetical protein